MQAKRQKSTTFFLFFIILIEIIVFPLIISVLFIDNNNIADDREFNLKTSDSEITVITPENKTYTEPMSGYYPATYGFENDTIGENPTGWTLDETAGTINIISGTGNRAKVVELTDTDPVDLLRFDNYFSSTQGYGTVEFWFRMKDEVIPRLHFELYDASESAVMLMLWRGDANDWRYSDGIFKNMPNLQPISPNSWYHLAIHFEQTAGGYQGLSQYRFKVVKTNPDGSSEDSGELSMISQNHMAKFRIATHSVEEYIAYVDAVGYSWDSNYKVGDNLNEGLLLSFENSTTLDWIGYSLDGQANVTIGGNSTIPFPSDNSHSIIVSANNTLGTMYYSNKRWFTVDTSQPANLNIITPENNTYTEPISGYYLGIYGFENDDPSTEPSGWITYEIGGTLQVIDELSNHKKVVELLDTSDTEKINMYNDFEGTQIEGIVEFWVRGNSTGDALYIRGTNGDTGFRITIRIESGKIQYYYDAGGGHTWHDATNGAVSSDEWHYISIEFNCTTDTFNVYLNDNQLDSDVPFESNAVNIDRWYFETINAHYDYKYFIDAVGYSWDSNYNIGDNLNEGLLLSIENGTVLDWMGYSLDGQANITIGGNTTIPFPSDGCHSIVVSANNTLGTMYQSDKRWFTIDTFVEPPPDDGGGDDGGGDDGGGDDGGGDDENPAFEVTFSTNTSIIIQGEYVKFTSVVINGILPFAYEWDFDDKSAFSMEDNPIYQFNSVGVFNVTLIVEDDNGNSESYSKLITVNSDEDTPPEIPGFNIFITLGILSISILIIVRKYKK